MALSELAPLILGLTVVLLVFGAIFWLWYFEPERHNRRKLARAVRSPIADVQPGTVAKVQGRVATSSTVTAPSGRPCACFGIVIKRQYRRTRDGAIQEGWQPMFQASRALEFDLVDETGRARVDASNASLSLAPLVTPVNLDHLTQMQTVLFPDGSPDAGYREVLAYAKAKASIQVYERAVLEGQQVVVFGKSASDGEVSIRFAALAKPRLIIGDDV